MHFIQGVHFTSSSSSLHLCYCLKKNTWYDTTGCSHAQTRTPSLSHTLRCTQKLWLQCSSKIRCFLWILMTFVSSNGSLVDASAIMNAFPTIKPIRCPHENTGQVKKISKSSPLNESHWLVLPLTLAVS